MFKYFLKGGSEINAGPQIKPIYSESPARELLASKDLDNPFQKAMEISLGFHEPSPLSMSIMLNNKAGRKYAINLLLSGCLFIVIIHHHKPERLFIIFFLIGRDAMSWLNTTRYRNATNLRERWACCLIKNYSRSERLTYSQGMLIIFTPK